MKKPSTERFQGLAINLAVAIASIVFLLAVVEVALRLTGFRYFLYPEDIEFGKPDPQLLRVGFEEDNDVFWVTPDYTEKLERLRAERPGVLFKDICIVITDGDEFGVISVCRDSIDMPIRYSTTATTLVSLPQSIRIIISSDAATMPSC